MVAAVRVLDVVEVRDEVVLAEVVEPLDAGAEETPLVVLVADLVDEAEPELALETTPVPLYWKSTLKLGSLSLSVTRKA